MVPRPIPPLSLSWTNAASQELVVHFELEQPSIPDGLDDLQRVVACFVTMGASGGFAREMVSPVNSSLSLTGEDLSSPTGPTFFLYSEQVDIRAFQLLRHCGWRWSADAQALRSISVSDRTPGQEARQVQLPDATWATEEAAYPPQSQLLQFPIERGDPADYQKERRCVVEFGRAVPSEVFESVIASISAWVDLAAEGAYGPPVRPSFEAEVWEENLGPYDEYSVEWPFLYLKPANLHGMRS